MYVSSSLALTNAAWPAHSWENSLQRGLAGCSFSSFEVEIQFSFQLYQSYLQDLLHLLFEKEIFWVFLFLFPILSVPDK